MLAGPEYPRYAIEVRDAIARLGLERDVVLLGKVAHDQVSDLTRRAILNLFLSSCENCPNILLELMAIGTPLLVSAREPMPELGGPDLDYVEPYDVDGIVRVAQAAARRSGAPRTARRGGARTVGTLFLAENRRGDLARHFALRRREKSSIADVMLAFHAQIGVGQLGAYPVRMVVAREIAVAEVQVPVELVEP